MTSGDELEQLELGILDLERRIFETSSRMAHESSEFGFMDRLRSMEETLAEMLIRRDRLRRQHNLHPN
jgi:hypothetical protein